MHGNSPEWGWKVLRRVTGLSVIELTCTHWLRANFDPSHLCLTINPRASSAAVALKSCNLRQIRKGNPLVGNFRYWNWRSLPALSCRGSKHPRAQRNFACRIMPEANADGHPPFLPAASQSERPNLESFVGAAIFMDFAAGRGRFLAFGWGF